jgi:hypothetical protein
MAEDPSGSGENVAIRLGRQLTPEFERWLSSAIRDSSRRDLAIPAPTPPRPGALHSGLLELLVHFVQNAAAHRETLQPVLEPVVKPAMEFLWGQLFDFIGKKTEQGATLPAEAQIVVNGNLYVLDPSALSRALPAQLRALQRGRT